ncbi:MAG: M50 family metallopeptidase [Saprospiraceae bacterium]|nr:M50 family metallopeptidase [Saprospiraceae bacterium]
MKKQQKSPWKPLLLALFLGGLGLLCGYYAGTFIKSYLPLRAMEPHGTGEKVLFLLLVFFAIWVVIAFHELGHLLTGIAQGFRVALYTAGFLGVRGTATGVRFFFNRSLNTMGGLAATFPEHLESGPDLRRKFVRIVAAGPLSSLFLSVIALLAAYFILQNPGASPGLAMRAGTVFLLVTGFMSAMIFLATMIPSRAGGFMSDGARLISLLDKGEKGLYEEAALSVLVLLGAGKLPGEYPVDLLDRLKTRPPDSLLGLNGHFLVFSHHLDRDETERALHYAKIVEDNIDAAPAPFQPYYLKDIVFFYAFLAQDAEAAHACWDIIEKKAEKDPDAATFKAKAALALLENKTDLAIEFAEKGLTKVTDLPFEGQRRFEEKWLWAVLQRTKTYPQNIEVTSVPI